MKKDPKIASQKLELLGQMTACILHDIKGPLACIKSNNRHLLKKLFALIEEGGENKLISYLVNILEENKESLDYMQEILQETGAFVKNDQFSSCSIHSIIDSCLKLADAHIKKIGQAVTTYSTGNDFIHGSPSQLRQVFLNLIINSCEAFSEYDNQNLITIKTESSAEGFFVKISDNGCGMSDEMQKSIFEWFVTSKEKGTGQGLPITKEILTSHEAEIFCQSELEKGTTFTITFKQVHK